MARDDFTKAQRDAWQRERLRGEIAQGRITPPAEINRFLAGKPPLKKAPAKDAFADLNKQINQSIKDSLGRELKKHGPSRGQIEEAAKAHKTLVATMPSTCFDSLTWRDGVATAVFAKDGSVYDYPMDVDDFLDWANSGSLGKTFNDEIR
jgi:hypothetical protein